MKNLILVVMAASLLSGCAGGLKSYYALQDECEAGIAQSCKDLRSRDRVVGTMAAGLEGYNQQQLIQAATAPQISDTQPVQVQSIGPVTTHCTQSPLGFDSMGGSITCTSY